jgi:hypothetical protein
MDDELAYILKAIGDALGQAQAFNRRNSYILMELVVDLAKARPEPQQYIADLFERVSARADQGPIEDEKHPASAEFRDAVSQFFSLAGQAAAK